MERMRLQSWHLQLSVSQRLCANGRLSAYRHLLAPTPDPSPALPVSWNRQSLVLRTRLASIPQGNGSGTRNYNVKRAPQTTLNVKNKIERAELQICYLGEQAKRRRFRRASWTMFFHRAVSDLVHTADRIHSQGSHITRGHACKEAS